MNTTEMLNNENTSPGFVLERIIHIGEQYPARVAVRFAGQEVTYSELVGRINRLSYVLEKMGVKAGSLVAIGLDRSIEMVVSIFSIWKTGAAFIPLDPNYPEKRLTQMLEDAMPSVLIGNTDHQSKLAVPGIEFLQYDSDFRDDSKLSTKPTCLKSEALAYLIYTSGSTGKPKGVQISHGALKNFLLGIQQWLQMTESDTLLAVTTLSFDISILEMVLPLIVGSTLVVVDRQVSTEGHRLASAIEETGTTFLQATPATWRLLLDADWKGKSDLTIICGGENFPRPLAEALLEKGKRIFNVYGPTEATIWATIKQVTSGKGPVSIGRALPNYEAHVLNDSLEPVAQGEIGQLYIGGESLAIGYLNRPEETSQRFIFHPSGARLYATGDMVREESDGNLMFVGRGDTQVKIRGFRVELGDIEMQLNALKVVKECVVLLREDKFNEKKLVAYIVLQNSVDRELLNLRKQLASVLPHYMIPHYFVELEEFPKTPNNKVDRKGLASREISVQTDRPPVVFDDPLESFLQKVWTKVLRSTVTDREDDFFDLGGDSILAAMITNHLQDWLGEVVWPVALFDAPTIPSLAGYLRNNYPSAIEKKLPAAQVKSPENASSLIDRAMLDKFNSLIPSIRHFPLPEKKNPRAIFILTPPRSGSTLLRVMLAGNPVLFAPPEIELLSFNTMGERLQEFSGRERYRLEGMTRAVMEIKNCNVDEAQEIISEYEKQDTPVSEFYGIIQSWLGKRILVDKTPANSLDIDLLKRVDDYFDDPLYIHLTRHPLGMIRSFMKARLSEVFFRRVTHDFSAREVSELIWLRCHQNILTLLETIPDDRKHRLSFEGLTGSPEETMHELCGFMDIEFHYEMVKPEKDKDKKMTDGLHDISKMMGDPKFHSHKKIDPMIAYTWKKDMDVSSLGELTRSIAGELGYDTAETEGTVREEFVL